MELASFMCDFKYQLGHENGYSKLQRTREAKEDLV